MSASPSTFSATLSCPDLRRLAAAVVERLSANGPPIELEVNQDPAPLETGWLERAFATSRRSFKVQWTGGAWMECFVAERVFVETGLPIDPPAVLAWLAAVPFEIATFAPASTADPGPPRYLERRHRLHGWGCAFRGASHDRLVSRRWLEHGPWALHRGAHDTSLVVFGDLPAGHARMADGWISEQHRIEHEIAGLYTRDQKRLEIVVLGRAVSEREMLDACATRFARRDDPADPITTIAYVFMDETEARAHLRELWLRELECWTIRDGARVRLDATEDLPDAP